jgi:hypothetical protein
MSHTGTTRDTGTRFRPSKTDCYGLYVPVTGTILLVVGVDNMNSCQDQIKSCHDQNDSQLRKVRLSNETPF